MANQLFRNAFSQIQKHFLKSFAAPLSSISPLKNTGSSSSAFTVNFLVENCGLPLESAISVSKKFQLDERKPQKPQSVLQLLRSHHFSDNQVAKLIIKFPEILHFKVEDNLQPKFEFLVKNGVRGELLPHVVVSYPRTMRRSLDSQIIPCFKYLRSLLHSDEKVVTAIMRSPSLFNFPDSKGIGLNIDILRKEGVPLHSLEKFVLSPRAIYQKPERIMYAVNAVKNLGIEPTAPMFIATLTVVMQMSESTLKNKIEVLKSIMGFDEQKILKAFKRFPQLLAFSEAKIRNALDFYLNIMQLEPKTVMANPVIIGLSIEKRVRPRCNVLKVLETKKLIEGIKVTPLFIVEKDFLKTYVDQYKHEVPDLLEMYLGTKESKKIGA